MERLKRFLIGLTLVLMGILIGGYLFSDTQPRSFLTVFDCENCLERNELMGLVASLGVRHAPGLLPAVIRESDSTLVLLHPQPEDEHHYLIIPKRDIRHMGEIAREDEQALMEALAMARTLIEETGITRYRLWTSGPGFQSLTYLHFHLAGS